MKEMDEKYALRKKYRDRNAYIDGNVTKHAVIYFPTDIFFQELYFHSNRLNKWFCSAREEFWLILCSQKACYIAKFLVWQVLSLH